MKAKSKFESLSCFLISLFVFYIQNYIKAGVHNQRRSVQCAIRCV